MDQLLSDRPIVLREGRSNAVFPAPVYSGVPQVSVPGPLLFLVYINDLRDVISNRSLLYGNDLNIWMSGDPSALQEDIINVKNWSISWNLRINDAKCAHMSLGGTSANRFIIHDGTKASDIPTLDLSKWYLTRHSVMNVKKPGKLRMVFYCAAKYQGVLLIDYLS